MKLKSVRRRNRNEKPNQILETVNENLDFNKAIQKQRGLGLKY